MVAVVDEKGYEGMRVADVASRAGVSLGALYEHFGSGQDCFLATFETLMEEGVALVSKATVESDGSWEGRLAGALDTLFELLVAQPAAARLCFLEAYAAGPAGAELRDRAVTTLEALVSEALDESPARADMPPEVTRSIVGGIRTITQTRLRRRQEHELPGLTPELLGWLSAYRRPQIPLRSIGARVPPGPRFVATSHRDRLFVALADVIYEKDYVNTIVVDVVSAAGVSLSTFYENFEGKEAAFLAACDFGIEQAFAAVQLAWEREASRGWAHQVRAGMSELLAFLASEPKWSYMAMVEIFAAGPRARARRDRTIELFTGLVEPGRQLKPEVGAVTVEALGGAVYSLMHSKIRQVGAERLPEILPATVFVLLTPFVGSVEAAAIAGGTQS